MRRPQTIQRKFVRPVRRRPAWLVSRPKPLLAYRPSNKFRYVGPTARPKSTGLQRASVTPSSDTRPYTKLLRNMAFDVFESLGLRRPKLGRRRLHISRRLPLTC